jgi:hypothetical protein
MLAGPVVPVVQAVRLPPRLGRVPRVDPAAFQLSVHCLDMEGLNQHQNPNRYTVADQQYQNSPVQNRVRPVQRAIPQHSGALN